MHTPTIHFLFAIWFIPKLVFCGYPISDPYDESVPIKTLPYNLIDTNPTCFWNGVCPMFYPGGKLGVFPNSEERFQHILHNMHRLFLNQSTDITLGYLFYGNAGDKSSFAVGTYCGKYVLDRHPLYWYSDANQLARWKQYDENTCNQDWYGQTGNDNHVTCKWGTSTLSFSYKNNQYSLPEDRCSLFSDNCGYGMRAAAFCRDFGNEDRDRCMFESEGICGGNSCLSSSVHCDPIFADKYDYVGKGFVAGMNGACSVYSRRTKQIWYQLPIGAHFDERMKIPSDMRREDGKHFGLWLEYHDINKTQKANACYALYDGQLTEMSVLVSRFPFDGGDYKKGSYSSQSYKALFLDYFAPPTSGCEPYAFICRTSSGNIFRLPEDSDYYFGTEWIDWKWSDYNGNYGLMCKENHYYYDAAEGWTVNGGPTLTQSDIWFYQENNQCVGCQKIEILDCLSQCIYNSAGAPSQICQDLCLFTAEPTATTKALTQNPTLNPAPISTKDPSQTPTNDPTQTPTENPSKKPSELPTKTPSAHPSTSPTTKPTLYPTKHPTNAPSSSPTEGATENPSFATTEPTQSPTKNPTAPTTNNPTISPTNYPTQSPTFSTASPTTQIPTKSPSESPISQTTQTAEATASAESAEDMFQALGVKQYVVFAAGGGVFIGCIVIIICGVKCCKKVKVKKEATILDADEMNVANIIQMQGMSMRPGPQGYPLTGDGRGSTDRSSVSTNGSDNKDTKAFIKQRDTAPPMRLLGRKVEHNVLPSVSYETPHGKCADCGETSGGRMYDTDGQFYCNECWANYE